MVEAGDLTFEMGIETYILFFRIENSPNVLKETSLRLLLLPCNPHIEGKYDKTFSVLSYVHSAVNMGMAQKMKQ